MNLLAFDTSTSRLFAAVQRGQRQWLHEGAGGAQASGTLIPALLGLLADAGLPLQALDAIVFGRGPGSFTGLRTACAVAQGLAYGTRGLAGPPAGRAASALPVLPVDTLLAVAEAARLAQPQAQHVLALLDARMGEIYAAEYAWTPGSGWHTLRPPLVCPPEALPAPTPDGLGMPAAPAAIDTPDAPAPPAVRPHPIAPPVLAGNAFAEYGPRLPPALAALPRIEALPGAAALLSLAPALLAQGAALPAEQALPLYIRDKVALTTAERLAQGGLR